MGTADLSHSAPSAEGIDASGITALLDALEGDPDIRLHGLVLLRHGAVVAEGWWAPYAPDRVQLVYSLSKSFTTTAAGFARAEGLLELDRPVLEYFPEYADEIADERMRNMTVRHIAAMASGHASETIDRALAAGRGDMVLGFLRTPLDGEPGTVFAYNQPCTYTLAAIIQRVTGQSLVEYLTPRLFEPLGIRDVSWFEGPPGRNLGFSGLHATTDAVARLGQLYLQGGRWDDRQLLDPHWVEEATRVQVQNPGDWGVDWSQGYGLQFWMSRHGFRGDGAFGQFCLVLPEQDAVLAITSETAQMQRVLDRVWLHLLPAFDRAGSAEADAALAERLGSRRMPLPQGDPAAPAGWSGGEFAVSGSDAHVTSVSVRPDGGGWTLGLVDAKGELALPVGLGDWAITEPEGLVVAVAGAWTGDVFTADVLPLDTPHTLRLACAPDGTGTVRWLTEPLHEQDLRGQRRP